ncbi:hypothetical protein SASPL_124105 [Salvia splendens]|uniref:DC-UbP/UBTD2 N-terminal domain-containing protein n=1 Tax=Salvia splendens TaxID=180675 RepID=A0A8X8XLL0_SALSN|nr:hypothetical protein SASPL_124105 [Salvia splendens]
MGCAGSRDKLDVRLLGKQPLNVAPLCLNPETSKKIRKPKAWKHSEAITREQLTKMREEFWDTAPHYGGRKGLDHLICMMDKTHVVPIGLCTSVLEIWDALRAAAEADLTLAQTIVDCVGIIIQNPDLTICYDERGAKYELPKYVVSEPTNLIRDSRKHISNV